MKINKYIKLSILKINKFLFKWYYGSAPEHFHQWRFRKSVKLLIQNYEHTQLLLKNAKEIEALAMKDADNLRVELQNLRIAIFHSSEHIDWANKNFGTGFKKPEDN